MGLRLGWGLDGLEYGGRGPGRVVGRAGHAGKGEGQLLISRGKEQGRKPSRRRDRIYLRFQPRSLNSSQAPQPHRPLSPTVAPTATKLRLATRPPGPSSTLLEAPRSFLRTAEANLHRLSFNRARGVRVIPRLAQRAPYRVGTNAPREQVTSRKNACGSRRLSARSSDQGLRTTPKNSAARALAWARRSQKRTAEAPRAYDVVAKQLNGI